MRRCNAHVDGNQGGIVVCGTRAGVDGDTNQASKKQVAERHTFRRGFNCRNTRINPLFLARDVQVVVGAMNSGRARSRNKPRPFLFVNVQAAPVTASFPFLASTESTSSSLILFWPYCGDLVYWE